MCKNIILYRSYDRAYNNRIFYSFLYFFAQITSNSVFMFSINLFELTPSISKAITTPIKKINKSKYRFKLKKMLQLIKICQNLYESKV